MPFLSFFCFCVLVFVVLFCILLLLLFSASWWALQLQGPISCGGSWAWDGSYLCFRSAIISVIKNSRERLSLKLRVSLEIKGTYCLVCVSVELLTVPSFYTKWYQSGDLWVIYKYLTLSCWDVWETQPKSTGQVDFVTALMAQFSACVRGLCHDPCTGIGNGSPSGPFSMFGQGVVLCMGEICP